jgi:hypothetical protein
MDIKIETQKIIAEIEGLGWLWEFLEKYGPYWTAPASARKEYHGCEPGGLARHSFAVLKEMVHISSCPKIDCVVVALLHDIGKAGDEEGLYFVPEPSQWHREKLGQLYKHNDEIRSMPHATRSIWICMRWGLKLTKAQFHAIMYHDGMYAHSKDDLRGFWPLTLLLHSADMWVSQIEKL